MQVFCQTLAGAAVFVDGIGHSGIVPMQKHKHMRTGTIKTPDLSL